jgi:hypothetical protein
MTDDNGDLFGARQARDEGMRKVAEGSPDYLTGGMALIARLPNGSEWTGEQIRLECVRSGLRYHHPNVHGTLIKQAVERGLLRRTGRMVQPKAKPSHGRGIHVYRVRSVLDPLPLLPESVVPPPRPEGPTNARLDAKGRLIHNQCAVCASPDAPYGVDVAVKEGVLGMWYCQEHWTPST